MKLNEDVCLTTYFNPFDRKMAYHLRDKETKTLRDVFRIVVNIENNRKAFNKLGRRDDPKLFNPKYNKKESDKVQIGKKHEEPTMNQILDLLKKMNPPTFNSNKPNVGEKNLPNNNQFNR